MKTLLLFIFTLSIPINSKTETWLNFGGGLNYTTFFLILLTAVWFLTKKQNTPLVAKTPLNLPIFLFALIIYLHLWVGSFKLGISPFGPGFNAYKRFVTPFILFFIITNSVYEKKTMKILVNAMFITIIVMAFFTLKKYHSIGGGMHFSKGLRFHVVGLQPNHLGAFFAQYVPISAGFILVNKGLFKKIPYLLIFGLGTFALMFTFSRGAYLSIIAASIAIVFFGGRRLWIKIIPFCILIVIIAGIFGGSRIIPNAVKERFQTIQEENKDTSIRRREQVWDVAKQYIRQSPFIGYGYGASKYILPMDTHNMYLDIALEAGIPALLLFIWLLIKVFLMALKVYRRSNDTFSKAVSLSLIGSLFALTTGNFFGTRFDLVATNAYFMILAGIVARLWIDLKNNGPATSN